MQALELKRFIHANKKISFVLSQLGCHEIKYHPDGKDYWSCANPDGNNKNAVNVSNNEYLNCKNYTRDIGENADIISLVQFYRKTDFRDAIKYLHKILGLQQSYFTKPVTKQAPKKDPLDVFTKVLKRRPRTNVLAYDVLSENVFYDFVPHIHVDLFREGIVRHTIDKFKLAYSYKHQRTIFPFHYWQTGESLGYTARSSILGCEEFDIPKYYITPGYPKSINLYGLYENYNEIQKAGYITVFESEKAVLKRDSRLDRSCVALSGSTMSPEQCRIICGLDINEVVIALDNDLSVQDYRHMCERFYGIRIVSYIHDKWNLLPPKSNASDASNKIYEFLFKHRVRYDEKERKEYLKELKRR